MSKELSPSIHVGRRLLPQRRAAQPLARVLHHAFRYGRDQQHLLSAATRGDFWGMEAACATRIRLRGQGEPLSDAYEEVEGSRRADRPFFSRAKQLGSTFGPVLYQLPPRWPLTAASLARFETFLKALPRRRRHVVEFREPSWYTREVFARLDRRRVALCLRSI